MLDIRLDFGLEFCNGYMAFEVGHMEGENGMGTCVLTGQVLKY